MPREQKSAAVLRPDFQLPEVEDPVLPLVCLPLLTPLLLQITELPRGDFHFSSAALRTGIEKSEKQGFLSPVFYL